MKQVIVLVGPTGVGKTKTSIDLAKTFNGEIISGDAYQIYKQLSIGSAKITNEEMQGVTHYLVDELDYRDEYNVKIFQTKAREYIDLIHAKGKIPIICGGTGLYIKAALYDYVFVDEARDETYELLLDKKSNEELYAMLCDTDQESAAILHPNNRKRVKRALMMHHLGTKKSEILAQQQHTLLYDAYIVGLTTQRDQLYERINQRVLQMIDDGLKQEVLGLIHTEADFNLQSMQGIGYKEWKNYYLHQASEFDTITTIQKNTRNFAKRQYTWFRNQMDVHWYEIDERQNIINDIKEWIQNG